MQQCLIVSRSARALANSAVKAGYEVVAISAYADSDTLAACSSCNHCQYSDCYFDTGQLQRCLNTASKQLPNAILIAGSGLETAASTLWNFSADFQIYCNTEDTVDLLTDPVRFKQLLNQHNISTPRMYSDYPGKDIKLLCKRKGSMGGEHVSWANEQAFNAGSEPDYFEAFIAGDTRSVTFLADGKQAVIVGYNKQWQCTDFTERPFLYQGASSVPAPAKEQRQQIDAILSSIVAESRLCGLCGMDYIVDESNDVIVLEINPRPPATFELHESEQSLLTAHVDSFNGRLQRYQRCPPQRAYVIIFARHSLHISDQPEWPDWCKDRPPVGSRIEAQQPVCTVHAEAELAGQLQTLLQDRTQELKLLLSAFEVVA